MIESLIGFGILLLSIIVLRIPIALAMACVGGLGFAVLNGLNTGNIFDFNWMPVINTISRRILTTAQNYELTVIPLFILMGNLITLSGLSGDLYQACYRMVGHFRGGLAHATMLTCGFFASICGSSLATSATMTKVALPPMRRYKYSDSLATASIAAGGTLGILIPPSVIMIVYGLITQTSIRDLFAAGLVPGVIGILFYMAAIYWSVTVKADAGPAGKKFTFKQRIEGLRKVWPILGIFIIVIGGIYGGIFTPNEAAGIGAFLSFICVLFFAPKTKLKDYIRSFAESVKTSCVLFSILIGALIFSDFINRTGLSSELNSLIVELELPGMVVIFMILILYVLLGMVFESFSMITLTVPIFYPLVAAMGYDLVWFGIIVVVVTEISLITPPIGLNIFVLCSVDDSIKINDVFKGVLPFIVVDIIRLALLTLIPALSLFLPQLLFD